MILKSILLAASLCVGLSAALTTEVQSAEVNAATSATQDDSTVISGHLGAYVLGSDGWTYFMLDNVLLRIQTKHFKNPVPEFGTMMWATGCKPDTSGTADYVCERV